MDEKLTLVINKTGLQTTIQDGGRMGWQQYGVPVSGAMDKNAFRLANLLVGNPTCTPCLEMTIIGPEISCRGQGQIALTGADLHARLNGREVPRYQLVDVFDGDCLDFRHCRSGCRCYLAVRGEWEVPLWLGSHSEVPYTGMMTGLPPPVTIGREIVINSRTRALPLESTVRLESPHRKPVGIVPGPEFDWLNEPSKKDLVQHRFVISSQSNRMGYRLEGFLQGLETLPEMISSGVIPGTVQVTPSGQLIILMADAQTTGGYPRIATVIQADLDFLAQKRPGEQIEFVLDRSG